MIASKLCMSICMYVCTYVCEGVVIYVWMDYVWMCTCPLLGTEKEKHICAFVFYYYMYTHKIYRDAGRCSAWGNGVRGKLHADCERRSHSCFLCIFFFLGGASLAPLFLRLWILYTRRCTYCIIYHMYKCLFARKRAINAFIHVWVFKVSMSWRKQGRSNTKRLFYFRIIWQQFSTLMTRAWVFSLRSHIQHTQGFQTKGENQCHCSASGIILTLTPCRWAEKPSDNCLHRVYLLQL